jgi:hypothetical protein
MKGRMCLPVAALLLLSMIQVGGWAQENFVPKGDEELYGTWANEKNNVDVFHGQKVVVAADGMDIYCRVSDPAPGMEVSWEISSKWTDSEGNVWYKTLGTSTGGVYKGANWQALEKINKSGTVWERAVNYLELGRFNPAFYPRTIDPNGTYYRLLYRTEK